MIQGSSRRGLPAAALSLCLYGWPVLPRQEVQTFRAGVELSVLHVQVMADRGHALPELTATDFTIRIGSRTPPVLHAEHARLSDDDRRKFPFDQMRWPKDEDAAIYDLGVDASDADCRKIPRVSLNRKRFQNS